jgi:hypothetical protein
MRNLCAGIVRSAPESSSALAETENKTAPQRCASWHSPTLRSRRSPSASRKILTRRRLPEVKRVYARAVRLLPAAGTYGNVLDGFEVTDSLPIPTLTGVFAAMENMTLGALSVTERPFHSKKANDAGVPTSYGRMLGKNMCTLSLHRF